MREIKFRAWDGKYEVGDDGSVWSLDYNHTGKRRQMRTYLDADGYPYVFFNRNGVRTKKPVHRLVAELFLERPSDQHQVNHKNGIRSDARLENLEWVTHRENVIHSWQNGRSVSDKQRSAASVAMKKANHKRWHGEKA